MYAKFWEKLSENGPFFKAGKDMETIFGMVLVKLVVKM